MLKKAKKEKKLESITFVGNKETEYIAFEPGKKIKRLKLNESTKDLKGNEKRIVFTTKKLTTGQVVIVAYNGLQYKTQLVTYKRKITYTNEGLNKKIKLKKGVKKSDLTQSQYITENSKKLKNKLFTLKGKKFCGYSTKKKAKKSDCKTEIKWGKGKNIKLYPQFFKK